MSALPIVLDGASVSALVVGGGRVALRKVTSLLDAGAIVRVVAPAMVPELETLAVANDSLTLTRAPYSSDRLGDALLVVAATDNRAVNARVAADARAGGRLVNVADAPELGNFVTPAVHRDGDVVVAVTTGGVPGAAARIRDAVALTVGGGYAGAVRELNALRRSLLDAGQRERWRDASRALVGDDFCELVESGDFAARVAEWR